jgi:hypothetical protein
MNERITTPSRQRLLLAQEMAEEREALRLGLPVRARS